MDTKKHGGDRPFVPPGRTLDLEYAVANRSAAPLPTSGLSTVQCPHCKTVHPVPFDSTLRFWSRLVDIVSSVTGVPAHRLNGATGGRPSQATHRARALLVQVLHKLAGKETARRWLKNQGWGTRRINYAQALELHLDPRVLLQVEVALLQSED